MSNLDELESQLRTLESQLRTLDRNDDFHFEEQDYAASNRQVAGTHYKEMEVQPSAFITRNKLGWCEGNAIKYICRHSIKGGADDIDKAIHYLELLKEIEYSE